jgi:glycosyltransferase involved in cell wall biosynthesis
MPVKRWLTPSADPRDESASQAAANGAWTMSDPKAILIVTHVFPPAGGVPVQRPLSFAKYLPDNGYHVHVLTARNAAAPVMDPSLLRHVPSSVTVHRSFSAEPPFFLRKLAWRFGSSSPSAANAVTRPSDGHRRGFRSRLLGEARKILSPDPEVAWVPFATRMASKIIRRHRIGTVLLTAPPFSIFMTGNTLKRRFPHLRIVADFRDEWLNFYLKTFDFGSSSIRERAAAIERETVESASLVLSVTPSIIKEIRERYPEHPDGKFVYLPNGYDPDAFTGFEPRRHGSERVIVTFVGTVYKASSPRYFLDAVDALPPGIRERFETRFIGRVADDEKAFLKDRKSDVKNLGFLPQAEAFRHMQETDYLLVTMTDASSLTGKIFEYLATRKPILAFARVGGEIDKVLEATNGGWCVDPDDRNGARELLMNAANWASQPDGWFQPAVDAIKAFERPAQVARLARLMQDHP